MAWNLGDLYAGLDDPAIDRDLEAAHARARAFETRYRGKIAVPGGPPAKELLAALVELES